MVPSAFVFLGHREGKRMQKKKKKIDKGWRVGEEEEGECLGMR